MSIVGEISKIFIIILRRNMAHLPRSILQIALMIREPVYYNHRRLGNIPYG